MDRKAKKKKEREQKKKEARRQAARSPFEKLESPLENLRAVINEDWFETKVADVIVRRDLGPGLLAIAWFKISLDVAGLQLAEGQLDAVELDWEESVADYSAAGKMVPCEIATVRMLVQGGVRIAAINGLRLPERWDKWARIYGPAATSEELAKADLTKFDQGYYGTTSELRDRLIGSDVRTFVDRTDIDMDPEDDAGLFPEWAKPRERPEIVLDDDEAIDEDAPERVLARHGETPHPDLATARQIHILAGFAAMPDTLRNMDRAASDSPLWQASVEKQINEHPEDRRSALREAFAQYQRYVGYAVAEAGRKDIARKADADP